MAIVPNIAPIIKELETLKPDDAGNPCHETDGKVNKMQEGKSEKIPQGWNIEHSTQKYQGSANYPP